MVTKTPSVEPEIFDIALSNVCGSAVRGFVPYQILGRAFYEAGAEGFCNSVKAVQDAGLMQAPPYLLVNGRGFTDVDKTVPESSLWLQFHDTLAERCVVSIAQGKYGNIPAGVYVVDNVGAGLFVSRPELVREAMRGNQLQNGAMVISDEMKNMLFGDKELYQWDGKQLQRVPVKVFSSFEEFDEASKDQNFLREMPVYCVLRKVEDARENPSGYCVISVQRANPDLIIPSGGRKPLETMLNVMESSFNWKEVGAHHDDYKKVNTGRPVVLSSRHAGVSADGPLYSRGRSVGVAPEALAVAKLQQGDPMTALAQDALQKGAPFDYNGKIFVPVDGVQLAK